MNSLEELLFLYPNYKNCNATTFNGNQISLNPLLTWKMIKDNPDFPWSWNCISKHPNITWQIVSNNPDMPWDWTLLLQNPNITWELVHQNWKLFWDSENPYYSSEEIENKLELKLTGPCDEFSANTYLKIMKQKLGTSDYNHVFTFLQWEMNVLSTLSIPSWDIIQKNPNIGWNFEKLSEHPNLTWDIIQSFPTSVWNWSDISCHSCISWQIVQDNPNYPWILCKIAQNPNTPSDILAIIIEKHVIESEPEDDTIMPIDIRIQIQNCVFHVDLLDLINWYNLSRHPNLTWQIVQNNLNQPWDWYEIANHPNLTWQIIQNNPNLWCGMSDNLIITWDIVEDNPDKPWNYHLMSYNINMYHEEVIENLWKDWNFETICSYHNVWNELCELGLNNWMTYQEYKKLE